MLVVRTVVTADPAVRANLLSVLAGPGAPAGVQSCFERDDLVTVRFDDDVTPSELIDDLITIESHFVPPPLAAPQAEEEAARLEAVGLGGAGLDPGSRERQRVGLE